MYVSGDEIFGWRRSIEDSRLRLPWMSRALVPHGNHAVIVRLTEVGQESYFSVIDMFQNDPWQGTRLKGHSVCVREPVLARSEAMRAGSCSEAGMRLQQQPRVSKYREQCPERACDSQKARRQWTMLVAVNARAGGVTRVRT